MTTTTCGTIDRDRLQSQIRYAAYLADLGWSAETRKALESAYRRGFADAEDAIAADAAPSTSAEPDSPDATDQLMSRAYAAAADKLAAAAKALADAAEAARIGQRNLAIGTALGAEADAARAKALTYAMNAIARI